MSLTFHWLAPSGEPDAFGEDERDETYLTRAVALHAVAEELERVRRLAKDAGRSMSYGVRLRVVTRDTSEEAWSEVDRLGTGATLVGSYEEVAERISEYADLGVDHFVLSGHQDTDEARRFAEGVVPTLVRRGLVTPD